MREEGLDLVKAITKLILDGLGELDSTNSITYSTTFGEPRGKYEAEFSIIAKSNLRQLLGKTCPFELYYTPPNDMIDYYLIIYDFHATHPHNLNRFSISILDPEHHLKAIQWIKNRVEHYSK